MTYEFIYEIITAEHVRKQNQNIKRLAQDFNFYRKIPK